MTQWIIVQTILVIVVAVIAWCSPRSIPTIKHSLHCVTQLLKSCERPTLRHGTQRESRIRVQLEQYFQHPFPKLRPSFLRNPSTGKCLELDCYNEDLQLAVEVNGAHHYHYTPFFHGSQEGFQKCIQNDTLKKQLCKANGVRLICIPYTLPEKDVIAYVVNHLQ